MNALGVASSEQLGIGIDPALHNRLDTHYYTFRFLGIAVGSLVGTVAWAGGGWSAVAGCGRRRHGGRADRRCPAGASPVRFDHMSCARKWGARHEGAIRTPELNARVCATGWPTSWRA